MTLLTVLAWISLCCAMIPFTMTLINLLVYREPVGPTDPATPSISLLIPARNEEGSIESCVKSALKSRQVNLEVVVLDDQSEDRTAELVQQIAEHDSRVRLVQAPPLPEGWCGKQHACWVLSQQASHDLFCFIDADVQLEPDALARTCAALKKKSVDLLSGFPRQETQTFLEWSLIPLIHFILLGFLPLPASRLLNWPAFAAGCGQFFLTTRTAYEKIGGHTAVKTSLHDGVTLPRAYRRAGLKTDIVDLTNLVTCRMYRSSTETWQGLTKNATEGLAAPAAIVPWTILLGFGQVVPYVLILVLSITSRDFQLICLSIGLGLFTRLIMTLRFRQHIAGLLTHPLGVTLLLMLQWTALIKFLRGQRSSWKGRTYNT